MAKIVKELLTKWTYKVDSRQLKATATVIKNLHKAMTEVRKESVSFAGGEVKRLSRIKSGWQSLNQEVRIYKANLRGARGGAGGFAGGGRGRGGGGGGGRGGRGRSSLGTSGAFLAGNVLKSPMVGSLAMAGLAGGPLVAGGLAGAALIAGSVGAASRKQQAEVGLQTFARAEAGGDAEKARESTRKFMGELNDFAKRTPFGVGQLRQLALQMKGFGFATDEVIPKLSQLGDLTGGRMDVLRRMLINLAQIRNLGKAQTVDLKQIANAGIPIQQKLADMLGKTRQQIQAMIPQGQITAKHIERAFREMTSAGGMFFGQMEERSKTLGGQWEKLKENLTLLGEAFGGPALSPLTFGLRILNQWIESMMAIGKAVGGGIGRVADSLGALLNKIPGMKTFLGILKTMGKVWLATLFIIPLVLEDIGAFFDGKDSFTGDFLKWLGFEEGDEFWTVVGKGFDKLGKIFDDFWESVKGTASETWTDVLGSDFVKGIEDSLSAVVTAVGNTFTAVWDEIKTKMNSIDEWFLETTLGKFMLSKLGAGFMEAIGTRTNRPTSVDGGSAEPSGSQSSETADNRSQSNIFNVNQGGLGEAVASATNNGVLNLPSRAAFQSQYIG